MKELTALPLYLATPITVGIESQRTTSARLRGSYQMSVVAETKESYICDFAHGSGGAARK